MSQSLWFRSLGIGNPGFLLWVFQAEIKVIGTAFSPKAGDLLPSSLVLTVTHFLVVVTSKSQSQALNPGSLESMPILKSTLLCTRITREPF